MNDNKNIPFILRYFYRDIIYVNGSVSKVYAVCKKCSQTYQGTLSSPTVFITHLKSKNHDGLHEEYLKLQSQECIETMECMTNHSNTVDGPIITLFKNLMNNDHEQITVLNNTQLIDILEKEFLIDVKNTHELEVEIYVNVVKKYLKDWPEWKDFEKAASDMTLEDGASVELLRENHVKIKDYLSGFLEIAKIMAQEVTNKMLSDDSESNRDIIMEIQATKSQLKNLILRHPNSNMFNINEPDVRWSPQKISLESIINSCGIAVEMRLRYSKTESLYLKYENMHTIKHKLVNRKLNVDPQVQLKQEWQVKFRKNRRSNDIFKEAVPTLLKSYNLRGEKVKWKRLFASLHEILNNITQNMPDVIDSSANYKRHLSKYNFVRYFYTNSDGDDSSDFKYDIQLEETIAPTCLLTINFYTKGDHEDSVRIQCNTCQMTFSGLNVLPEIEVHVATCHDAETAWSCTNCKQSIDAASLTKMNWQHQCLKDEHVASSSIQATHIV